jgi:hypothetical protein
MNGKYLRTNVNFLDVHFLVFKLDENFGLLAIHTCEIIKLQQTNY